MVRPPEQEIARLMQVAREIRETTEDAGYRVGLALEQHASFTRTNGPASTLERSLVLDAARAGASKVGLWVEDVSGGGLDIVTNSDITIRRYRVKRVKLTVEGEYDAICGEGSSLIESEPESLYREEKWVIGYITSDDHTIDHLVAAEIIGWRGNGPVHLVFGSIVDLSSEQPPPGFTSTEEGLPGFDDDEDTGQAEDASSL